MYRETTGSQKKSLERLGYSALDTYGGVNGTVFRKKQSLRMGYKLGGYHRKARLDFIDGSRSLGIEGNLVSITDCVEDQYDPICDDQVVSENDSFVSRFRVSPFHTCPSCIYAFSLVLLSFPSLVFI